MLYQCDEVRYYDVSNFGDYKTLYDAMLAWFNSAQSGTEPSDASSATTTNAVSRDSLIKAADSYVDLGGYLCYTAGGELRRYRSGVIETVDTLPIDYLNDTPVNASLSTQDDRLLMSYHIGGATSGSFVTDLYGVDGKRSPRSAATIPSPSAATQSLRRSSSRPRRTTCTFPTTAAGPSRRLAIRTGTTAPSRRMTAASPT